MQRKPELGKYLLWHHFQKHATVRPYLPSTRRYSHETFRQFLEKYGMIYVKPSGGSMGRGVLKVWRNDGAVYVHKTVMKPVRFTSVKDACKYIDQQREGKPYIVQKGILLALCKGRPMDMRVMMQRTAPGGPWLVSGMLAKIAGRGSVVTNVALSRGQVTTVEQALKESLGWSKSRIRRKIDEMRRLALTAASHFDTYQNYREIGFDMAVDTNGRLWLIEQNTAPSHPLFKKLSSNMNMYYLIERRWAEFNRNARYVKKKHG